jgi:hypothetical protein
MRSCFSRRWWSTIGCLVAFFAIASQARGSTSVGGVRDQFTGDQWRLLQSVKYLPIVLPAHLPPGFHVAKVALGSNFHDPTHPLSETYFVTYENGKLRIIWSAANYSAGGDAASSSFALFKSPVLGNGVVKRNVTDPGHPEYDYYYAEGSGLLKYRRDLFLWDLQSTTTSVMPGDMVDVMNSMVLVRDGMNTVKGDFEGKIRDITSTRGNKVAVFSSANVFCDYRKVGAPPDSVSHAVAFLDAGTKVLESYDFEGRHAIARSVYHCGNKASTLVQIWLLDRNPDGVWYVPPNNLVGH